MVKQSDKFLQFSEILLPLFRSIQNYRLGNLVDAYNAFEKAAKYALSSFCHFPFLKFFSRLLIEKFFVPSYCGFSAFIQEFRNWDSAWALEALYVVAYEIRVLAERVIMPFYVSFILVAFVDSFGSPFW